MCGIAGIWHRGGRPVAPAMLDRMTDDLAHRGPDDRGTWIEGSVGLGHRRLSILDLSADGRQPMSDPGGRVTISYNGEIYNYRSLREEIGRATGYRFRTGCDSEVIPIGYLAFGLDLFARLEGMFAIALWDAQRHELILARDAVGIKPLFVAEFGGDVYFASEIKALKPTGCPWTIDPAALHALLASGHPAPDGSLLAGVGQVPPGCVRVIGRDGSSERRFWRPSRRPEIRRMDEAADAVRATLKNVVADMLQSDVPVGVLQSGGIDSSLIACSLEPGAVPLFTAEFTEGDFDETATAAAVARALGSEHHVIPVTAIADPVATFRAMALAYDGQLADSSGFAFYELCRAVRRHVTVALSGEGGDEFFAGYPTYRASRLARGVAPFLPRAVWRTLGLAALARSSGNEERLPVAEKFARFCLGTAAAPANPHPQWRRQLFEPHCRALYGKGLAGFAGADPLAGYAGAIERARADFPAASPTDHDLIADETWYLPGDLLAKADRVSMAHGLEVRVPFLDRRIMDLAGRIDLKLMTGLAGPDKRVLRAALATGGAPAEVAHHPKRGFMVPVAQMLREHLRPLSLTIFEERPGLFEPFLDPDAVRRTWRDHDARRANHKYLLWLLLTLGVWLESHV